MMENNRPKKKKPNIVKRYWRLFRPIIVALISILICFGMVSFAVDFAYEKFFAPVDLNDATPLTITVPSNSGASYIAQKLYDAGGEDDFGNRNPGLISSKTVFKIYADFTGKTSKLKAGTYVLSRNMSIAQIIDVICKGNPPRATVRVTFSEGITVEGIADKLISSGVKMNKEDFLDICRTGGSFTKNYSFLTEISDSSNSERFYLLEGYLFPDTYDFYTDEAPSDIIARMLRRFNQIFSEEYKLNAQQLGMSIDEVVKLASLIEKEAKLKDDFAKVSAVFHARLDKNMALQSDAPLKYIFKTGSTLNYSEDQMNDDSPYNTYVHKGLPIGAIANPGRNAIEAALRPNEEFIEEGYLFFCLMDPETGENIYAKTNAEHERNVAKYRELWENN